MLGQGFDVVQVHQHPVRHIHIAQLGGHLHDVLHRPAGDGHLSAVAGGHVDDLLDAVHVGGEGGDDDALLAAPEQGVEGGAHAALAAGKAGALHVGGVGQQGQHPLLAQLAQAGQVHHPPLDGGGVDLEGAGVDTGAHGALDGKGHCVGDGVVHMDELHAELARLHHVPGLAGDELGLGQQAVLLQLQADQAHAHAGGIDGGVDGAQHIGQGPDVVLVSVGDEDAPDLALVLDEIAHVGNDHVDAVHIVIREAHAAVHHDDVAAVLIDGQVLPDLVQSAQGNNFQFFCHNSSFTIKIISANSCYPDKAHAKTAVLLARRKTLFGRSHRPCLAGERAALGSLWSGLFRCLSARRPRL